MTRVRVFVPLAAVLFLIAAGSASTSMMATTDRSRGQVYSAGPASGGPAYVTEAGSPRSTSATAPTPPRGPAYAPASPGQARAGTNASPDNWTTYGGDLASRRYRRSIRSRGTTSTTSRSRGGSRPSARAASGVQLPGDAADGRTACIYTTAGTRRAVVALDAATGEMLWMHSEDEGKRGDAAPRQLSGRGLAYWTDGREERIVYVTPGYQLVALDAKTGIARRRLRQERHRRSEAGRRSDRSISRPARSGCTPRR